MDVVGFLFSVLYIQFIYNHKNKTNKKWAYFLKASSLYCYCIQLLHNTECI